MTLESCNSTPLPNYRRRRRGGYLTSISYRNKIPNWVAENLSTAGLDGPHRRTQQFVEDHDVPTKWRSGNTDYFDSGFSRGHMACAANHKDSVLNMMQTFLLSGNCLPQDFSNNSCDWYRSENLAKRFGRSCENVYVVSGPLWLPQDTTIEELKNFPGCTVPKRKQPNQRTVKYSTIGSGIAVPTHLWKVVVAAHPTIVAVREAWDDEKQCKYPEHINPSQLKEMGVVGIAGFIVPNAPENNYKPLADFQVSIDTIETTAGVDLSGLITYCKDTMLKEKDKKAKRHIWLNSLVGLKRWTHNQNYSAVENQSVDPVEVAIQERQFLSSINLCGTDGRLCEDDYVKTDKRIISARYLGRVMSETDVHKLDSLWTEIKENELDKDFFLRKNYDLRREKITELSDTSAATSAALM